MLRPTFRLGAEDAAEMLSGLLAVDLAQMRRAGPNRPRIVDLIESGQLRYSRLDPEEHWQTYEEMVAEINARGFAEADCEDLATALAAELRMGDGRWSDPQAAPVVYRSSPRVLHVVVKAPNLSPGHLLDPSRSAGMGWNE